MLLLSGIISFVEAVEFYVINRFGHVQYFLHLFCFHQNLQNLLFALKMSSTCFNAATIPAITPIAAPTVASVIGSPNSPNPEKSIPSTFRENIFTKVDQAAYTHSCNQTIQLLVTFPDHLQLGSFALFPPRTHF